MTVSVPRRSFLQTAALAPVAVIPLCTITIRKKRRCGATPTPSRRLVRLAGNGNQIRVGRRAHPFVCMKNAEFNDPTREVTEAFTIR